MVASVFRLRRRSALQGTPFLTPGYPVVPAIYVVVLLLFLASAIVYNPVETLVGMAMTATGVPIYLWTTRKGQRERLRRLERLRKPEARDHAPARPRARPSSRRRP